MLSGPWPGRGTWGISPEVCLLSGGQPVWAPQDVALEGLEESSRRKTGRSTLSGALVTHPGALNLVATLGCAHPAPQGPSGGAGSTRGGLGRWGCLTGITGVLIGDGTGSMVPPADRRAMEGVK